MGHVFISFEKSDADVVVALAAGLERSGVRTWYDLRDALPGPSYLRQINTAITDCTAVIVIASPASMTSEQVTSEIVQAFEQQKPIVPVRAAFRTSTCRWATQSGAGRAARPRRSKSRPTASPDWCRTYSRGWDSWECGWRPPHPRRPRRQFRRPPRHPVSRRGSNWARGSTTPRTRRATTRSFTGWPSSRWTERRRRAPTARAPTSRLVLDVSGSMDKPNRYPLLREAVRQLVCGLAAQDRVSVTLFSDRSRRVVPFMAGAEASDNPDAILRAMDSADNMFGSKTMLAPALQLAVDEFVLAGRMAGRVRRTYVLTDGELHDTSESETVLQGFRPQSPRYTCTGSERISTRRL